MGGEIDLFRSFMRFGLKMGTCIMNTYTGMGLIAILGVFDAERL